MLEVSQTSTPVELISFNINTFKNENIISWSTATEINNKGFEIQRSSLNNLTDQKTGYKNLGFVTGNGSKTESSNYSFDDKSLSPGIYFYRLKQIDLGGQSVYSKEIEAEIKSPVSFNLSQNYPNPFNPSTKIDFTLPENSDVTINMYSIIGELVSTLVHKSFEAGYQFVNFNASGLPSGVYIYRMVAKGFVSVKKMSILK